MWGLVTRGRETRDLGTSSMGRGGRVGRGRGTSNTETRETLDVNDYCDNCDFSHFPREYVLVKAAHPTLLTVPPCKDSAKTPFIEESETTVLVFLLMEYWSPKPGRVGCGRQKFTTTPQEVQLL